MAGAGGLTPSLPPGSSRTCSAAPHFPGVLGGGQGYLIPPPRKIPTSEQRCLSKPGALSSIRRKAQAQKKGRRQEVGDKRGSAGHPPLHPLPAPCQGPAAALGALPPRTVPFPSRIHGDCFPHSSFTHAPRMVPKPPFSQDLVDTMKFLSTWQRR